MEKRTRREYTKEFKQQIVSLHAGGKPACEIVREYYLTASTFHKWVNQFHQTGSFKAFKAELMVYVYWFNNKRIHGTLGYKSPFEFKESLL